MSLLTSALKSIGANTLSRFTTITNNYISENILTGNYSTIQNGTVNLKLSEGSNGYSHATNLKEKMQNIEWSRGFSWDVHLSPKPPAPFNDEAYGIPVVDVDAAYTVIGESRPLDLSGTQYSYPGHKSLFGITLTLLDDERGTMEQYFENWMNQIYLWNDDGGHIGYLDESVRTLTLAKLTSLKTEIFRREYLVYPEQGLKGVNNSTGAVRQFNVLLNVAGYVGKNSYSSQKSYGSGKSFIPVQEETQSLSYAPRSINSDSYSSYSAIPLLEVESFRGDTTIV